MLKSHRIVLVEDNPDDEHLTLRALRKLGGKVEIVVARDGQEALDLLFDAHQALPDLVLLDLKLPKISGLDVLERLRRNERTAHLLIVVLTSSDEPSDIKSSYQQYANSFIRKPVDYEEFSGTVSDLGMYWLYSNLAPPKDASG